MIQLKNLSKLKYSPDFDASLIVSSLYRPFFKLRLYNDFVWINSVHQMYKMYPFEGAENLSIITSGKGSKEFSCLMTNQLSCLDCLEKSQCFPRYLYHKAGDIAESDPKASKLEDVDRAVGFLAAIESGSAQEQAQSETSAAVDDYGYVREDAIKPEAVAHFRQAYPEDAAKIDADSVFYYIYGVLHSPEYRSTYANNLQKELARIPRVATYDEFAACDMLPPPKEAEASCSTVATH